MKNLTIPIIRKIVADYFGIDESNLDIPRRKREIVKPRQFAMVFAKQYTKNTLATIGAEIGGKDHATVLAAIRTISNLFDTDKETREQYQKLDELMGVAERRINLSITEDDYREAYQTFVSWLIQIHVKKKSTILIAAKDLRKVSSEACSGNVTHKKRELLTIANFLEL